MWIVFSGTEEFPIITKFIYNKSDLNFVRLDNSEWIEEFETKEEKNDRKIRTSNNSGDME